MERYELGDIDVDTFARDWLARLDEEGANSRGLLEFAAGDYAFGSYYMMSNIGPAAVAPTASREQLVLFAVLAAYQSADFPGAGVWSGESNHLDIAFAFANELGRTGVARMLLEGVAGRSDRETAPLRDRLLNHSLGHDPARLAAHDREIAHILDRDIRAARLLDPTLSIDSFLMP